MPELPEVEVLRRSLDSHLKGRLVRDVQVHFPTLREPIPRRRMAGLRGRRIQSLRRRAKYLLIDVEGGKTLVIHLGMSGRLTLAAQDEPLAAHEHLSFALEASQRLRLVDPRRFGLALVLPTDRLERDRHFAHLGVEPFDEEFSGELLRERARGRRSAVKLFLMDARIVVGVGNIYASEALFRAGVHPKRSVARIAAERWSRVARCVVEVLGDAVRQGGTTLNDFRNAEGDPGYFQVALSVYGREGEPCPTCSRAVQRIVQGQRSTFYCGECQR